jgi:hypothetical protein
MKKWLLGGLAALLMNSCSFYQEDFTKYDEHGIPDHTVKVTHMTFFMTGEAAKLKTYTNTEDFIREVNAEGLKSETDKESIAAITEGVTRAFTRP